MAILVFAPTMLPNLAQANQSVVVVPVDQDEAYNMAARLCIATRRVLASRGRVVTAAAVALAPKSSAQAELVSKALARYKEGVESYDGLEFKRARALFREAADIFRRAMQKKLSNATQYTKTLHYLAAAALYDNDRSAASASFAEAVSFSPKQSPDNAVFSPDVLKVYEEEAAASAKRGSLNIVSNPPAEVLLNGRAVGATPMLKTSLRPGNYLVTCRRASYESDSQWIVVQDASKAEVRTELKALPQGMMYTQTLAEVARETRGPRPGPATSRLLQMLRTSSAVLVSAKGGKGEAVWTESGRWTKRFSAAVAPGSERAFATRFVESGGFIAPPDACARSIDCGNNQQCVDGRCVAQSRTTPFYKTWWFWTVVGVAVAGGATGAVLGTMDRSVTWRAELRPGGTQ